MYKPIKDITNDVGTSKTAIYNKIGKYKDYYSQYIKLVDGVKCINEDGIKALKNNTHSKAKPNKTESKKTSNHVEVDRLLKQIEELKADKKYLQEQLDTAQKNIEREQSLHYETKQELKLLKAGTTTHEEVREEQPKENKPKGFWSRLFNKE